MFRTSGGKYFGIKLLSTVPPDYYESGGYWQLTFLFWQVAGDVICYRINCYSLKQKENKMKHKAFRLIGSLFAVLAVAL